MQEHEIVARFDGSPWVEFPVRLNQGFVVSIGHEFGYALEEVKTTSQHIAYRMVFRRDDSEMARQRAAWAQHMYRTTGAWWAVCWPPHLHNRPETVHPTKAGEVRLALHRLEYEGQVRLVAMMLIVAALTLIMTWLNRDTLGLAIPLGAFSISLLAGTLLTGRLTRWTQARHQSLLARFENQRHYPSPNDTGRA
jgi:hypothetical protein